MAGRLGILLPLVGLWAVTLSVLVTVHVPGTMADCPTLTPVPIDENWFFSSQPKGGFYPIAASGIDGIPKNRPKPMTVIKSAKKVCGKTKALLNGHDLMAIPPIECVYDTPGQYYCVNVAGIGPAGNALRTAGFFIPKEFTNTIVDTDNETFVAVGSCMDGNIYEWAIYTPTKGYKKIHAASLKALQISRREMNDSTKKKFSSGRAEFTQGACKKSDMGMGAVADGLSGLLTAPKGSSA